MHDSISILSFLKLFLDVLLHGMFLRSMGIIMGLLQLRYFSRNVEIRRNYQSAEL